MSDQPKTLLPVGTRIRFLRELTTPATGDHPAFLFASRGQLGTITGHGTSEGYWAKTDDWPNAFGAAPGEFEVVTDAPPAPPRRCEGCDGSGSIEAFDGEGYQIGEQPCPDCGGTGFEKAVAP